MKYRIHLVALMLLAPLSFSFPALSQSQPKPEWKLVGSQSDAHGNLLQMYFDPKAGKRTDGGIIQVWIKYTKTYENEKAREADMKYLRSNRELNGFSLDGYERFGYSTMLLELDCSKGKRRYPCIRDYDKADKVIGEQCIEGNPWEHIPEASTSKKIMETVCSSK